MSHNLIPYSVARPFPAFETHRIGGSWRGFIKFRVALCVLAVQVCASVLAGDARDQSFDFDWRFQRGDAVGVEDPRFDDSNWRTVDVPHDWSIEDLPAKTNAVPEFEAVTGEWCFHKGDNPTWSERTLDDSGWQKVTLPAAWEEHSGYNDDYVFGWYRRHIQIPAEFKDRDFDLLLGRIDDADEVFLNGQRIGGTGSFPPSFRTAWDVERRYRVPASLVRGDGTDVLAVRVFDGERAGGIYASGTKAVRIGPFDPQMSENADRTGYVLGGIGWYRKHFTLGETNKRVSVRFDGVYMNSEVWINGHYLGNHPHGYTAFEFDLTPHLNPAGEDNVLAVRVRNEGKNSRWYSGSGIYRHVWFTVTEPVHVPTWGVFVSTPEVSDYKALVSIAAEVCNATGADAELTVTAQVMDRAGELIGSATDTLQVAAGATNVLEQRVEVPSPKLWSPESPNLYLARVEVLMDGQLVDAVSEPFGIRSIQYSSASGFLLNGESLLLKGGCIHHDNGPLGAAAIDRAEERKIELLKANGYNAVRSAHNPPSSALLDACDRLGMLVIDEAFDQWNEAKIGNEQDYHRFFDKWCERDIASMVRRDRNHPSVIMWSIGNEIPEQFRAERTQKRLRDAVLSHDTTRPVTQAICDDWGGPVTRNWDELSDPAFKYLDVAGYNYLKHHYEGDHSRHPDRVMYGSESYAKDAFDYWEPVEELPYVIGDFVWTAVDYLGETGIGHSVLSNEPNPFFMPWPYVNAWCGDLDICGFKKPQSLCRDVIWRRSPIEMTVHAPIPDGLTEVVSRWGWPKTMQSWNWSGHEGTPLQVSVYSRCEKVRLELNGKVIGEKPVSAETKLTARFDVPYAPGELRALGLVDGRVVAKTALKTSGPPVRLTLTADRTDIAADRDDLAYVTVEVVDANGQRVPTAEIPVHFSVGGPGALAGQASGAPNVPASFQAPQCKTFRGRCLAVVRSTGVPGKISLKAEASGLEPETIVLKTDGAVERSGWRTEAPGLKQDSK